MQKAMDMMQMMRMLGSRSQNMAEAFRLAVRL